MKKPIEVTDIFFDLDHTLWDFEKNSAAAFNHILPKHKIAIGLSEFLEAYQPINSNYWRLYEQDKITKEALRHQRLERTFLALNLQIPLETITQLSEEYIQHLPETNHLFPDTEKALGYLHKKYTLHIITNGFEEVQHRKLRNSGIDHYFKTITTSEEAGVKKPHPKIFEYAVKKAGCSKTTSLMIGDNLEADVRGALDFGMQAIHFSIENQHPGWVVKEQAGFFEIL